MAAVRALRVVAARLVRNAAPRARVQPRLMAGGFVAQAAVGRADVVATAARGQQGHVVEEVEAEPAQEHRLAGGDRGQVHVGRVGGPDVAQAVPRRVRGHTFLLRVARRRQMALREDDRREPGQLQAVVQDEGLEPVGRLVQADGACRVDPDADRVGGAAHRPREHPLQIAAVAGAGGVVVGPEPRHAALGRPLVQARPRTDGTRAGDARVREEGHLRGDGVHEEFAGLPRPPDAAGARRRGVDDVDRQEHPGREEFGRRRAEPFEHAGAAGARADQSEGGRMRCGRARCGYRCGQKRDSRGIENAGSGWSASSCRRGPRCRTPVRGSASGCGVCHVGGPVVTKGASRAPLPGGRRRPVPSVPGRAAAGPNGRAASAS